MRKTFIFIALMAACHGFAAEIQFKGYLDSLSKRLLIDVEHLREISHNINLKKFGLWSSRNAEATYTPFFDTLSLKESYLIRLSRGYRVRKFDEFEVVGLNSFFVKSSTIFHEMSHGDYEVYIKGRRHLPIYATLNEKLPRWFDQEYSKINTKTATHELLGYMASDIISILTDRIQTILTNHGVFFDRKRCFSEAGLQKIADRLNLSRDNLKFQNIMEEDFTTKYVPKTLFINGKSYDLKKLPQYLKKELLDYFIQTYDLPRTMKELVVKLNESNLYSTKLRNCYYFL